jgi:hypothetical protein
MLFRLLRLVAFLITLVCAQGTYYCNEDYGPDGKSQGTYCLIPAAFTCGATGQNTTWSYSRTADNQSTIRKNITLTIAWEPTIDQDGLMSFSLQTFVFGPELDEFNVTHVYRNPGTYTPFWKLWQGSGGTYNCGLDFPRLDTCPEQLDQIVISPTGCTIIPYDTEVAESYDTSDGGGSRQRSPWIASVWLASLAAFWVLASSD